MLKRHADEVAAAGFAVKQVCGIETEVGVRRGLADFVQRLRPDLLVMGSRGMGAVKKFFVGSVADYLVKEAPCPVLVIKDEDHSKHLSAA